VNRVVAIAICSLVLLAGYSAHAERFKNVYKATATKDKKQPHDPVSEQLKKAAYASALTASDCNQVNSGMKKELAAAIAGLEKNPNTDPNTYWTRRQDTWWNATKQGCTFCISESGWNHQNNDPGCKTDPPGSGWKVECGFTWVDCDGGSDSCTQLECNYYNHD